MRKNYLLPVLLTVALNIIPDRLSKFLAALYLPGRPPIRFPGDLMVIQYAENTGAFLSMGTNWPPVLKYTVLLILPIIICVGVLLYAAFREQDKIKAILMACFAAGGLGNLIDRLFNNFSVVDFLNFGIGPLRTGILNIADLSITFAAVIYIIYEFRSNKKKPADEGQTPN
ncbi:MAG: signal peptidase II [Spirochaetes bacterium]|nr:signal peptidase II [Spirochaetota bacterium]